jgi:hypothetical protein
MSLFAVAQLKARAPEGVLIDLEKDTMVMMMVVTVMAMKELCYAEGGNWVVVRCDAMSNWRKESKAEQPCRIGLRCGNMLRNNLDDPGASAVNLRRLQLRGIWMFSARSGWEMYPESAADVMNDQSYGIR